MPDDEVTVLAVDDIDGVLLMYERSLEDRFEVRTASSGQEALEVVDGDVDVVLLDRRMPGPSGDEVVEVLAEGDEDLALALASAVPPEEDILGLPCDAYIEKPTVGDDLVEWVARLSRRLSYPPRARELAALLSKLEAIRSAGDGLPGDSPAVEAAQARVTELASELLEEGGAPDPRDLGPDVDPGLLDLP